MIDRTAVPNRFQVPVSTQKSLSFNGTSSYATIPLLPEIAGWNLGFWVNNITIGGNAQVFSYSNTTNGGFIMYQSSLNRIFIQIFNGGSAVVNTSIPSNTIVVGKYYHIAVTYAPNNFKLYLNTVIVASDTTCTMTDPDVAQTLTVGRRSYAAAAYSKVNLKNITFQNTATPWTQAQIDDLYWRNKIPSGALQWSLNDVATDQNGENALTLSNTSYSTAAPFQPRTAV